MNWKTKYKIFALLTIIALITLIPYPQLTPQKNWEWIPPSDQELILEVSGQGLLKKKLFLEQETAHPFIFHTIFKGTPFPTSNGMVYHLICERFSLGPQNTNPLISFQRLKGGDLLYTTSKALSSLERKNLFDQFHINLKHHDPSSDRSLFQQPIQIAISRQLQINEIILTDTLRNSIAQAAQTGPLASFIKQLLTQPDQLPSMLSKKSKSTRWQTDGYCLSPLVWTHTATPLVKDPNAYKITTLTSFHLSNNQSTWQLSPEITNFTWIFSPEKKQLESLNFDFSNTWSNSLMGNREYFSFDCKFSLNFSLQSLSSRIYDPYE